MGLLSLGTPLDWSKSRKFNEHVRENGIEQLINIFKQHSKRENDVYFWGDEVEYMLVDVNDKEKTAKLSIDKDFILDDLNDSTKVELAAEVEKENVSYHPEYGRFMIEATPLRPYDGDKLGDYVYVEDNMIARRKIAQTQLPDNILPLTLTAFPRMGCQDFTSPSAKPIGPASQSLFLPDEIINRHVRFPTLTANIRKRRGCKVAINLPIYPDVNTKLLDDSIPKNRDLFASDREPWLGASKPGHVYLDSMGFGMGSSCLQVTMQAKDITQARYLYDTLAPLTPILLSASAAAPIFKGFLVDQDVRWNVISGAVDDRTFIERDVDPYPNKAASDEYDIFGGLDVEAKDKFHIESLGGGVGINGDHIINEFGDTNIKLKDGKPIQKIPKSRYESIDNYLGGNDFYSEKYNDIYSPINSKVYEKLLKQEQGIGFDEPLARHFSHLFIRDPLVLFSERIDQDNTLQNDHFENIQLTNWQTLRFKPPALYPEGSNISPTPGWRVEFRPMEIQLTDFENAAYSIFISLLSKAIIKFNPNFYIPISKIDENMKSAHKVDSAINEKFWFRNPACWELKNEEFSGYDLTWFDRFIYPGNDEIIHDSDLKLNGGGDGSSGGVYLNGYAKDKRHGIGSTCGCEKGSTDELSKLTVDEIINGNETFPGLIKLIVKVIALDLVPESAKHCNSSKLRAKMIKLQNYLKLISYRASGKIPTIANWLRKNATQSPLYKKDSKISDELNYELIEKCIRISNYDNEGGLLESYLGDIRV